MISFILEALKYLLRHWRGAATWAVRIGASCLLLWPIVTSMLNFSNWALSHFAYVFNTATSYMDDVMNELQSFVASTGSSFCDAVLRRFEISFFLEKLVGWGALFCTVIEVTLFTLGIALLVFLLRLAALKWKQKMIENVANPGGGL